MTDKKVTSPEEVEALRKQVVELEARLVQATTDGEEAARRAMYFRNDNEEVPTGKTVMVPKLTKFNVTGYTDEGMPIKRPVFEEVELPTYLYKVDLPPVGGVQLLVNGTPYFHGETYELTIDDLRTVKEMVYRIRSHEANIHGTDENAYRPKTNATFSGKVNGRTH